MLENYQLLLINLCAWYLSLFKLTYDVLNYGELTTIYSSCIHFKLTADIIYKATM